MNTTTNTRGVSEAMVDEGCAAFSRLQGRQTSTCIHGGTHTMTELRKAVRATIEAALSAEPAAQPEDSRCPPTYRREEAVKALIGKGWTWDGKAWAEPAAQGEAVYYEKRDWHHDGGWHRIDKATFEQYENYHKRFGGKSPVRALGVIAPPAQPAERVPEGCIPIHRTLLDKLATDMDAIDMPKIGAAIRRWVAAYDAKQTASPAPSEGVPEGVMERLISLQVGGCNCNTKTPELQYHSEKCRYRLAAEVMELLTSSTAPSEGVKGVEG